MLLKDFFKDPKDFLRTCFILKEKRKKIGEKLTSKCIVISSDCTGSRVMYDYGLPCYVPNVNLGIRSPDFIKYVSNLDYYTQQPLIEDKECMVPLDKNDTLPVSYPVALCGDIRLYFAHGNDSFELHKRKWEAGCKLLNRTRKRDDANIFIIMNDRNFCSLEDLRAFDNLPYPNKVVFVHEPHPEIKSAFYVPAVKSTGEVDVMTDFVSAFSLSRRIDCFDWISWFTKAQDSNAGKE